MNFKLVWIDCNDLMIQKSARFVSFNISQSMNYEPVFFIFLYLSLDHMAIWVAASIYGWSSSQGSVSDGALT